MAIDYAPQVLEEAPDMGLDVKLQDAEPFLGEIVVDQWEAGKGFERDGVMQPGKPQLHLGFKPLSFEIRGQTGMFHDYYNLSTAKRSKMGLLVTAFKELIGKPGTTPIQNDVKIGKGQLIGTRAWFVRKDISFGVNRDTGNEITVNITLPVRLATQEDIDQYAVYTEGTRTAGEAIPVNLTGYTADEIMALVETYAGHTLKDAQRAVLKNKEMAPPLKNSVMTGESLKWLVAQGHVTVDADGVVNAS